MDDFGKMHTCPQCMKEFYIGMMQDWAYKRSRYPSGGGFNYFCSYSCARKWDEKHPNKKNSIK